MQIDHPCANPACQCMVKERGAYCTEACRQQADAVVPRRTCECGHTACAAVAPENTR